MNLTDGEWHRLHPASPLLRGGIAFVAIAGFVIANLRERLVEIFFHVPSYGDDPLDDIYARGLVGWALLAVLAVLIVIIAGFYLSWRMHSFRVTDDLVEVRSGLLFRTHRRARLDRMQGVTITRSLLPRLFGAAKLDVAVAGNDGNVQLAYLGSTAADALRREILQLASGLRASRGDGAPPPAVSGGDADVAAAAIADIATADADGATATGAPASVVPGVINQRVNEFLAPELDADLAAPESVVRIPVVRLIGSVLLSGYTVFLVAAGVALIVGVANDAAWPVFAVLPVLIGSVSYYWNRVTRMLRYSIAGTPDGVRVGYGLLSTNNETLPPGRIHAIGVSQPLLWRPFGWWRIQVNTASRARSDGQNRDHTTVMPVGTAEDVSRVLGLMLPAFVGDDAALVIRAGLVSRGDDDYSGRAASGCLAAAVLLASHGLQGGIRRAAAAPRPRVPTPRDRAVRPGAERVALAGAGAAVAAAGGRAGADCVGARHRIARRRRRGHGRPPVRRGRSRRRHLRGLGHESPLEHVMSPSAAASPRPGPGGSASASSAPAGSDPCSARRSPEPVTPSSASRAVSEASRERADAMLPGVPILDGSRGGRAQRARHPRGARSRARPRSSPASRRRAPGSPASSCCTRPRSTAPMCSPRRCSAEPFRSPCTRR